MRTAKMFLLMVLAAIMFIGSASTAFAADPLFRAAKIAVGPTAFSTGVINLAPGTTAANGIYFGSDVTLYRSAADTLKTDDSLTVTGTLTTGTIAYTTPSATGNVTLGDAAADTVTVNGTPTFAEATTFSKTVGITGVTTLTGALVANGDCTLGNAVGDTITVSGTPTFAEAVSCSKTLGVTGASTLASVGVTGAATIGTTLGVTGATTLTGALVANGAVTLGDAAGDVVTINGTPTFAQDATFTNQIIANGNVTLGNASTDTITCTGRLIVRIVTDAGPMTATNGTQGEIVFETSTAELYICTVTGTPATWKACT